MTRLGGADQNWENRAHFFSAAAEAMRRILVEHARRRRALRHGGGLERLDLNQMQIADTAGEADHEVLEIHEALGDLTLHHPEKAELVKLRYFAGLTNGEAAGVLDTSPTTATRHWAFARLWLFRKIESRRTA